MNPKSRQAHDRGTLELIHGFKSLLRRHGHKNPIMAFHPDNPPRAIAIK
jgi:hypothetical protein